MLSALLLAASLTATPTAAPADAHVKAALDLIAASRTGSSSSFSAVLRSHADVQWLGMSSLGSYANALPAGR